MRLPDRLPNVSPSPLRGLSEFAGLSGLLVADADGEVADGTPDVALVFSKVMMSRPAWEVFSYRHLALYCSDASTFDLQLPNTVPQIFPRYAQPARP